MVDLGAVLLDLGQINREVGLDTTVLGQIIQWRVVDEEN